MAKNQSQPKSPQQGPNKPSKPPQNNVELNVIASSPHWFEEEKIFQIPFVLTATKGNWPLNNHTTFMIDHEGRNNTKDTDDNGVIDSYINIPSTKAGQKITLKFIVKGYGAEKDVVVTLPEVPVKKAEKHPHDNRVYLFLESYIKNNEIKVAARVTDSEGRGISNAKVNLLYCAQNHYMPPTDSEGNSHETSPITLEDGESIEIKGTVSGILHSEDFDIDSDTASTSIVVSKKISNNKKAVIFFGTMLLTWFICWMLWTVCWKVGWGDSIIINPPHTTLSPEEVHYNEMMKHYSPELQIKPEVSKGDWQKIVWYFTLSTTISTFFFTLFTFFYCIFIAPSDEIWKALRNLFNRKKKSNQSGMVGDSWWNRYVEPVITGSREKIHNKPKEPMTSSPQGVTSGGQNSTDSNQPNQQKSADKEDTRLSFFGINKKIIIEFLIELLVELAAIKITKSPKVANTFKI